MSENTKSPENHNVEYRLDEVVHDDRLEDDAEIQQKPAPELEPEHTSKLVIKLADDPEHENQPSHYYTTNVPLQQVERDFNQFIDDYAAEHGLTNEQLKQQGFRAEYNQEGNMLTLSFANANVSKDFFNKMHAQGKINGPFVNQPNPAQNGASQSPAEPALQPATPLSMQPQLGAGRGAADEDDKNGYQTPTPLKMRPELLPK